MSCTDDQRASCREGCCRMFAGVPFCDIESNCVATPTWIIVLVPVLLGIAALVLVIIVLVRLKGRNVMDRYTFARHQTSKLKKAVQDTQRNFIGGGKQ